MSRKGLYAPVVRKLITAVVLIGITGIFLSVYYLIYLPQTRTLYNERNFRILHEASNSFKQRIENYGLLYSSSHVSEVHKDVPLSAGLLDSSVPAVSFNAAFLSSFKGDPKTNAVFQSVPTIVLDSIRFTLYQTTKDSVSAGPVSKRTKTNFDTIILIKTLLEPIIKVHSATFQSVLLIKQASDSAEANNKKLICYDSILYKSDNADIANIATDSLFRNRNVQAPLISDLDIEGIGYKMFLLPFKINSESPETYVLAGIVANKTYKEESQDIPVDLLLTVCLILVVLLLMLPFLKIFFLSAEESITLKDVRTIILVIYIIPVFVTLVCSAIWLTLYKKEQTKEMLQNLQQNVEKNFYSEINQSLLQIKKYDKIISNPSSVITNKTKTNLLSLPQQQQNTVDIKDVVFYPDVYKNITSLHWMNTEGNDIAVWTLTRLPANYIKLSDRPYFTDIKYKRGYVLPTRVLPDADTTHFSILPVLSRLTGEYTINIAAPSSAQIAADKQAIAIGTSGTMYSVWNTVVPKGFSFCIVDETGNIICHSDTARNLQENIFQESGDSMILHSVINHKDSTFLPDVNLYEHSVSMIVKPMPNLPYYLITYYNKRGEYLFLFHILAFVFVCESALLILVSLFSYIAMVSYKKISKLLFTTSDHDWLKPSADKKNYYRKLMLQSGAIALLTGVFSLFYRNDDYVLYTLHTAILLPLFVVTAYYITRQSKKFIQKENITNLFFTKNQHEQFFNFILKIVALYILSLCLFSFFQNALYFNQSSSNADGIKTGIRILMVLEFLSMLFIAGINFNSGKSASEIQNVNNGYLTYFITSLIFSVILISVVPALSFVSYAFREEKMLQVQSDQIDLAKKIQQRRATINPVLWKTKLNIQPFANSAKAYISDLKFNPNKGIYVSCQNRLDTIKKFNSNQQKNISCSPLYKIMTQFLFLPPDHDEFYSNSSHDDYYNWSFGSNNGNDTLTLFYKNTTDNLDSSSFKLTSPLPLIGLFSSYAQSYQGMLLLLILSILIFLFYIVISSATKRVFLIGFFTGKPNENEVQWLKDCYEKVNLKKQCTPLFAEDETVNLKTVRDKENEEDSMKNDSDEQIIQLHLCLQPVYENIWKRLSDVEKYTLYDFATDGFTNYKQSLVLYGLHRKGLVVKEADGNITIFTKSFRNFLVTKGSTEEVKRLSNEGKKGSWGTVRTFFYIILIAVAVFIFISQEEASKRLITIVTSLGALLPAILKLFDKSTFALPASGKTGET